MPVSNINFKLSSVNINLTPILSFIHTALSPSQIIKFFEPIFEQAEELNKPYDRFKDLRKIPFITVRIPCCIKMISVTVKFCFNFFIRCFLMK